MAHRGMWGVYGTIHSPGILALLSGTTYVMVKNVELDQDP